MEELRLMTGKSKEEIAFELVSKLKGVGVWGENNMDAILDMYAECLEATSGLRKTKGMRAMPTQTQSSPQFAQPHATPHMQTAHNAAPQQPMTHEPMAHAVNPINSATLQR